MKKIILTLSLLISLSELGAQTFQQAFQAGGGATDLGTSLTTDFKNNLIVCGYYMSAMQNGFNISVGSNSSNNFLSKFDSL